MITVLVHSLLLLSVTAQYTWDCNHYSAYTVDTCYQYSSSYQYFFECNGTDAIILYQYTDNSCGAESPSYHVRHTYSEDSDSSNLFQCDQGTACDSAILRYYYDSDCSGDSYIDVPYIIGQCYTSSSSSFQVHCPGDDLLTIVTYSSSGDCTGTSLSATVDYEEYSDSVSGCYNYEVCSLF